MNSAFLHAASSLLVLAACVFANAGEAHASDRNSAPREVFALIIGETAPSEEGSLPLRFADDDAFATYALMVQLAKRDHVILLTNADKETRAVYPDIVTSSPTRAAIQEAADDLNRKMKTASSRGILPVFYFFYTGHGNVKNNEGYVTITDGRFSRTDLMGMLNASSAAVNHVIIDACKSYFMVQSRGKTTRRPLSATLPLDEDDLPRRTGFFLSTSSDADSHEWEVFQGGIFSHEMRSALRGAADLDENSSITYEEAAAFINRANASIPAVRFRPRFFLRPPDDAPADTAVLSDLQNAAGTRLRLGSGSPQHQFIEDGHGIRLLDIHPAPGKTVTVLVPESRPLFIRFPERRAEISVPGGDVVDIRNLNESPLPVATRGAEHEAFSRLFALPFDESAVTDYRLWQASENPFLDTDRATRATAWRRGLGVGGAVLLAVGGAMTGVALAARASIDGSSSGVTIQNMHERIHAANISAVSFYATGGAALLSCLIWTLSEKHRRRHQQPSLPSNVDATSGMPGFVPGPSGAVMGGQF